MFVISRGSSTIWLRIAPSEREARFTAQIRARGEEARVLKQEAGYQARRGVVPHTHSWMNRFRRVLIRWDKKVCNFLAFLHLVCTYITYRPFGLLG